MTGNGHGRHISQRPLRRRRSLLYAQLGRRGPRPLPPHYLRGFRQRQRSSSYGPLLQGLAILSLATLLFLGGALGAAAAAGFVGWANITENLPSVEQANGLPFATTKIYDRNWVLLNEVSDPETGWRTPVGYQEILDHITRQQEDPNKPHRAWIFDATVAAEDATFWSNVGFDPAAIARSFVFNLQGAPSSGASTITQQLVRLIYPEQIGFERSYMRKVREAVTAYRFTQHYTKEQILEMYLNNVYYGNRAYGIDAASMTYFNKHPWDLTLAEAAMLAGLPQAPSLYDPVQNYELAKARQRYVLDQMVKEGMITEEEAEEAYAQPINLQVDTNAHQVFHAPHFVNFIRAYLEQRFGAAMLYQGGLTVRTTLDLGLQERAQQIVAEHIARLAPWDVNNGALVAMLPWSGEIVAMVGSADYYNDAIDGQVNVAVRERQPGSSIKPITYLAAFEKGWSPGTIIFDYNKRWPLPSQPGNAYAPVNYTGQRYGAVSVRTALSNSLNTPAVQALDFVGVQTMIDLAHRMGIRTGLWRGPSVYGLAVTLGGGEVTLLEHTNAFATLANNGRYVPFMPLLEVRDGQDNELYRHNRASAYDQGEQVVKAEHAYQITSILTDNNARSMVFSPNSPLTIPELGRPVAAKTGTTEDSRDGWTMGYTTDLVVGVWAGNTDNHPTRGIDGVQSAAPIWHDFMVAAHTDPRFAETLAGPDGQPIQPEFPRPPGIYDGPVCAATGKRPTPGTRTINEVLVRGEGPTLPCNRTTPEEAADLRAALADAARSRNFTSRGLQTLYEYAAAVRIGR
ncbi:transglycosylase domain-containing protein [Sphaerobacter thermophilus]|uniref:Glycosyl transferase family 51 n=1 Tax=Sphaerobacter thermophilus (strain ATCC 49802 / DSM 20745 / KCCM 41009 / NCIMB 13125 / S 6022) TaxID=479434 RepID=D1CA15_SPHTD|nr:transglycosylase domain-containing protein [Sphaerobacter thermophilus]ACZ40658.1 glycosyl transferase family 51 [Sphaerobacter thermophilus DSM 20745]